MKRCNRLHWWSEPVQFLNGTSRRIVPAECGTRNDRQEVQNNIIPRRCGCGLSRIRCNSVAAARVRLCRLDGLMRRRGSTRFWKARINRRCVLGPGVAGKISVGIGINAENAGDVSKPAIGRFNKGHHVGREILMKVIARERKLKARLLGRVFKRPERPAEGARFIGRL